VGVSRESGNATTVTVRLSDFAIEASQATFTSGTRYHFLVINTGQTNHEFMIVPPPSGDRDMGHGDMGHRDSMALYRMDQSALPPGATKAFDFTFPSAAPTGTLEFACHVGSHYQLGMKAPIVVNHP